MPLIPLGFWPHITINEIQSLTEEEADILLYIVNVWAPIRPPEPTEDQPYPMTLNLIRAVNRAAIIDRVDQANSVINDKGKEIYNRLRVKLGLPSLIEQKSEVEQKSEINNGSLTGSNVQ